MHNSELILVALVLLDTGALVSRALATGRWGFGAYSILRREYPGDYWFYIVMAVAAVPLMLAVLIVGTATREHWPAASVILIPLSSYWLFRLVQTGRAPVSLGAFSRVEDPLRYWGTVMLAVLLLLASIGLAIVSASMNLGE